jgi:hypothetical protein
MIGKDCGDCEKMVLGKFKSRDMALTMLSVAVVSIILYMYMTCTKSATISKFDNKPRWNLGGLRDDTGATNNSSVFASGYGLDMTTRGAKTM